MSQARNTAPPLPTKLTKEKWGTNKDRTNTIYETTDPNTTNDFNRGTALERSVEKLRRKACIVYTNNMNLIGATYIRASKLSSHASWVGWPELTEFDFRPRLTSNPLHELRYNVQVNNISVVQRHYLQICRTFTRPDHMNSGPA